jgi:hypothetical protein
MRRFSGGAPFQRRRCVCTSRCILRLQDEVTACNLVYLRSAGCGSHHMTVSTCNNRPAHRANMSCVAKDGSVLRNAPWSGDPSGRVVANSDFCRWGFTNGVRGDRASGRRAFSRHFPQRDFRLAVVDDFGFFVGRGCAASIGQGLAIHGDSESAFVHRLAVHLDALFQPAGAGLQPRQGPAATEGRAAPEIIFAIQLGIASHTHVEDSKGQDIGAVRRQFLISGHRSCSPAVPRAMSACPLNGSCPKSATSVRRATAGERSSDRWLR